MAEVAYTFHWALADLEALEVDELLRWYAQAARINKLINGTSK